MAQPPKSCTPPNHPLSEDKADETAHDSSTRIATPLSRLILRDKRLTFAARGLYSFIWDLPKGWRIRANYLAKMGPEGRDAIRSRLRELEKYGALIRKPIQGDDGKLEGTGWFLVHPKYWASEAPLTEARATRTSAAPNTGKGEAKDKQGTSTSRSEASPAAIRPKPYGSQEILYGVEIWTELDRDGLAQLVTQFGAEAVEDAASATSPAPGHSAPYLSAVRHTLCARESKSKSDAAQEDFIRREQESINNAPVVELTDDVLRQLPQSLRNLLTKK